MDPPRACALASVLPYGLVRAGVDTSESLWHLIWRDRLALFVSIAYWCRDIKAFWHQLLFQNNWVISKEVVDSKKTEFRNNFLISKKTRSFRDGSYFELDTVSNREPSKIERAAADRYFLKN
jgi:hypothetical protein